MSIMEREVYREVGLWTLGEERKGNRRLGKKDCQLLIQW
jgi:hypothetical protein